MISRTLGGHWHELSNLRDGLVIEHVGLEFADIANNVARCQRGVGIDHVRIDELEAGHGVRAGINVNGPSGAVNLNLKRSRIIMLDGNGYSPTVGKRKETTLVMGSKNHSNF